MQRNLIHWLQVFFLELAGGPTRRGASQRELAAVLEQQGTLLKTNTVVAGHKKPTAPDDAAQQILDATRAYIRDFAEISRTANTIREIVSAMCKKYPDHGNVTTLLYSANAVVQARAC
jgi:hypothetical protein